MDDFDLRVDLAVVSVSPVLSRTVSLWVLTDSFRRSRQRIHHLLRPSPRQTLQPVRQKTWGIRESGKFLFVSVSSIPFGVTFTDAFIFLQVTDLFGFFCPRL